MPTTNLEKIYRYLSFRLLIDLLISNKLTTFLLWHFFAQCIFYELSVVVYTTINWFFYWFFGIAKKNQEKEKFIK